MLTTNLLEEYFQESRKPKFDPAEIRLSESGYCIRRRTYAAAGYKAVDDPAQVGLYETGHLWEEKIVNLYREKYPDAVTQQEVVTGISGPGHIDLWIPSQNLLVEIKTTSLSSMSYMPSEGHLAQIQAYLHFFNKEASAELVYIPREDPYQYRVFPVRYNPDLGDQAELAIHMINRHVADNTIPDRPYDDPEQFPCLWRGKEKDYPCPFIQECWMDWEDRDVGNPGGWAVEGAEIVRRWLNHYPFWADAKAAFESADETKKELQDQIICKGEKGEKIYVEGGGISISKEIIKETFDWKAAVGAGLFTREQAEPFVKKAYPYRQFRLLKAKSIEREVAA